MAKFAQIHLPLPGVKIALAARFLWFRGGPPRAMAHLGEQAAPRVDGVGGARSQAS